MSKLNYVPLTTHSDEMNDIIGHLPSKLVRYGIVSFLFILLLLFVVSWVVKYPDILNAPGKLYAISSPKSVTARTNGKLTHLLVSVGETVDKNQILGLLECAADYKEILFLEKNIQQWWSYAQLRQWGQINILSSEYKNLGELQGAFQAFYNNYVQVRSFISNGTYDTKKKMLLNDFRYNDSLKTLLFNQKIIYEKDYAIADSDYHMKNYLYEEKIIAKSELKQEESKLLAKKMPLENVSASILNNQSVAMTKKKEMIDLDKQFYELQNNFIQALNKLSSDVEAWKQLYVLKSPVKGVIDFPNIVQENQEITLGQELFYVESLNQGCYLQVLLDQTNFGKVRLNQSVIVNFPSYPFQEYGSLHGIVTYISRMPDKEGKYSVKVNFPEGLVTNDGYKLSFANELIADAKIITKKDRLFYKFLYTMQGVFHKKEIINPPVNGQKTNF